MWGAIVEVNDNYGISSIGTQGLKKTYRKLKISQETRLVKGFLVHVRYLIEIVCDSVRLNFGDVGNCTALQAVKSVVCLSKAILKSLAI
mgnify:CR=1 FL=1